MKNVGDFGTDKINERDYVRDFKMVVKGIERRDYLS